MLEFQNLLKYMLIVYCLLGLARFIECEQVCPPPEDIYPCICVVRFRFVNFECWRITSSDVVSRIVEYAQKHNTYSFHLGESSLQYIPKEMFEHVHIERIYFEKDKFVKLFEEAPRDPSVKFLSFRKVQIIGNWDWTPFSTFKDLDELHLREVKLRGLANFKTYAPKQISHIVFVNCGLKKIEKDVFQDFQKLRYLDIDHDKIKVLQRSMFPNPAKHLIALSFTYNEISTIPEDMFVGMPSLRNVHLSNNLITTLPENTYKPLLNDGALYLYDNPLRCDCEMKWILAFNHEDIYGTCDTPTMFKGKRLEDLTAEDFSGCKKIINI